MTILVPRRDRRGRLGPEFGGDYDETLQRNHIHLNEVRVLLPEAQGRIRRILDLADGDLAQAGGGLLAQARLEPLGVPGIGALTLGQDDELDDDAPFLGRGRGQLLLGISRLEQYDGLAVGVERVRP